MRRHTIDECRRLLAEADGEALDKLIARLSGDDRLGVRTLAAAARKRVDAAAREADRLASLMIMQRDLMDSGLSVIAGVDEVGRGALAGPVSACAVVIPPEIVIERLDDSKKLDREVRVEVAARVRAVAVACCVAHVEASDIDAMGIGGATREAWRRALEGLGIPVDHVLLDGNDGRLSQPCTTVIGGDGKVACIAAASVVAKVERDALMAELAPAYPGYLLEENKGYSTSEHLAALRELGPSPIHRHSFTPCIDMRPMF